MNPTIYETFVFAAKWHKLQEYNNDTSYLYHLAATAEVAERFDLATGQDIARACLLHDILEDTACTVDDLKVAGFSEWVIEAVQRVTDEPGANRKERKEKTYPKIAGHFDATVVKLCDRIANLENCIKEGKTGLISMYRKEHDEFKSKLDLPEMSHYWMLKPLWIYLDNLVENWDKIPGFSAK